MNHEIIRQAEEAVRKRAIKTAFTSTEGINDSDIQTTLFRITKDYIILGARMMQEELFKLEEDGRKR